MPISKRHWGYFFDWIKFQPLGMWILFLFVLSKSRSNVWQITMDYGTVPLLSVAHHFLIFAKFEFYWEFYSILSKKMGGLKSLCGMLYIHKNLQILQKWWDSLPYVASSTSENTEIFSFEPITHFEVIKFGIDWQFVFLSRVKQ